MSRMPFVWALSSVEGGARLRAPSRGVDRRMADQFVAYNTPVSVLCIRKCLLFFVVDIFNISTCWPAQASTMSMASLLFSVST